MEEDLAPSFRQVKHQGNDEALRENFDSIFRRNLCEPHAGENADRKRVKKLKTKFKDRQTAGMGGTLA